MSSALRNYMIITGGYWAFTLTDGAIRMLVVLYFHALGYSPFAIAMLFLFYEFFGIVTNLVGGWLGARIGLNRTMHIGMALQIVALLMLTVPDAWLSVAYVMAAQALSGIAKDLNKMSAKASVKSLTGADDHSRLFRWVAALTGSKNALKGVGFFLGALLLEWLEFRGALAALAAMLMMVLFFTWLSLPQGIGKMAFKPKFRQILSDDPAINRLSAARFFLFGARDVWFVVALPVFLVAELGWAFHSVGAYIALWVIGYGVVQGFAPRLLQMRQQAGAAPGPVSARYAALALMLVPIAIALGLAAELPAGGVVVVGLIVFGVVFALNSALHSYLILAYSQGERVALDVGFYYMANAGGRLAGTLLSGWSYQALGLSGGLWISAAMVAASALIAFSLPNISRQQEVQT
jgi:predicted MFS family arabinose efflux permease